MNDARSWKDEHAALNRYIADNPGIVISPSEISIPQNLREEFYRLFDKVRTAFVETLYSSLPVDIESLCGHYLGIEREVIALLGIEKISMPMDLFSFLHTPKAGLARILYNQLFDLLQGKITADIFEALCVAHLKASAAELYRLGYEWWAGLSLIKLLEPDEAFFVDLDPDDKPILAELKEISFGRQAHHPTIRIPELVLHSKRLDSYVAIKMAIVRELEEYAIRIKPPVRPKKRTGDTSSALDSRVMLLSFMSSKSDIPIVADIYDRTLTSPDWMVECITEEEFKEPSALELVRLHVDSLSPKRGMCLLVINQGSDVGPAPVSEKIRPVSVGFDQAKLQSVLPA
jgi:hypothetical protein